MKNMKMEPNWGVLAILAIEYTVEADLDEVRLYYNDEGGPRLIASAAPQDPTLFEKFRQAASDAFQW